MAGERRARLLAALMQGTPDLETKRLCEVCAEVTGMSGAGIMLMSPDVPQGSVCASNGVSALIEELQFALGEGPCIDAYKQGRPVLEPDLADPVQPRWLAFTGPVVDAGAAAVFGFPLRIGNVRLGVLDLYRVAPGPLTDEQHADSQAMAEIAAQTVLLLQAEARPGELAAQLEAGSTFPYGIHQAAGMVAVQLNVSVGQALIRLRAYAFGNDQSLKAVADDVVQRTLRFDVERDEEEQP